MLYDLFVLSMFGYTFFQKVRFKFTETVYVSGSRVLEKLDMIKTESVAYVPRRPLLVRLQRKWFLHDKSQWIACKNTTDALLTWLVLVKDRYKDKASVGTPVLATCFSNEFLC